MRLTPRPTYALTALLALALCACAGGKSRLKMGAASGGEVVEAEGFAANDASNLIATKRASLVDAQRNAVEKAVGVFISARTRVEKAIAIENNILARTDGYVKKYDILEEGPRGDLYRTKIRAMVALTQLEQDLREMSLMNKPELQRPRVLIELKEDRGAIRSEENAAAPALAKALRDQGFVVVSPVRAKDADILIRGTATAYPHQSEGLGGFQSYRARLSAEAVRSGTDDVVMSLSREASGLGGGTDLAGLKALETVGEMVGREMAAGLPAAWSQNKNLLVFVEGVKSFGDVEQARKHLQSQPGVDDLMLRRYDEQMAQFEVQLGSADVATVAAGLEASTTVPMKVVEAQPHSLRLKWE